MLAVAEGCDACAKLRRVVPEAPLRMSKNGLVTDGEGWFVVNARESRWRDEGSLGSFCTFEGKRRFPHLGINLSVLEPGQQMAMYHRENAQEAFLVLEGTCVLVVEGQERVLREWDFFHCPPGTAHVIVAAGGRACGGVGSRRAWSRHRRRSQLPAVRGGGPIWSQRRARDHEVCGGVRPHPRRSAEVELDQVSSGVAGRRRPGRLNPAVSRAFRPRGSA